MQWSLEIKHSEITKWWIYFCEQNNLKNIGFTTIIYAGVIPEKGRECPRLTIGNPYISRQLIDTRIVSAAYLQLV
jgi:hypothetical protein